MAMAERDSSVTGLRSRLQTVFNATLFTMHDAVCRSPQRHGQLACPLPLGPCSIPGAKAALNTACHRHSAAASTTTQPAGLAEGRAGSASENKVTQRPSKQAPASAKPAASPGSARGPSQAHGLGGSCPLALSQMQS